MDADCRRRPVVLLPPPPQAFDAPEPIVDAACGQNYTVATGASGKIYTFGNGGSKCLGHGDTARSPQLREVHQPLHTQPTLQTRICGYSLYALVWWCSRCYCYCMKSSSPSYLLLVLLSGVLLCCVINSALSCCLLAAWHSWKHSPGGTSRPSPPATSTALRLQSSGRFESLARFVPAATWGFELRSSRQRTGDRGIENRFRLPHSLWL